MKLMRTAMIVAMAGGTVAAHAQQITGAGGTFPAPVLREVGARRRSPAIGIELNYQAIGSGGGQNQITNRTVDFGASDAPMDPAKLQSAQPAAIPHGHGAPSCRS